MNSKVKDLVIFSFFLALEAIFCFTPLGSINLFGPVVATLAMIPVSFIAIFKGLKSGMLLGFFMGLFSLIVWTFFPPLPIAFIFTPFASAVGVSGNFGSLLICFVPRIMIGIVTYYVYQSLIKLNVSKSLSALTAALSASLAHSFLVLLGIYVFFADSYSMVIGADIWFIFYTIIITNAIPEAIVSGISSMAFTRSFVKK